MTAIGPFWPEMSSKSPELTGHEKFGFSKQRLKKALTFQGHFTTGGIDDRMLSMFPPVFRPNVVPRS